MILELTHFLQTGRRQDGSNLELFPHIHRHTGLKQGNPLLYLDLNKIVRKAFDDANKFTTVYSFDQF